MSPSNTSNNTPTKASIHDVWLRQRAELEEELLDIGNVGRSQIAVTSVNKHSTKKPSAGANVIGLAEAALPISLTQPSLAQPTSLLKPASEQHSTATSTEVEVPESVASLANIQQSLSAATTRQFLEHQQRLDQELTRQREAFVQEINRQRSAFEQELAARDAAWTTQRDREWAALQSAKEVHAAAVHRMQSDLAMERVREHEELQHWRRQAEMELTEARRLFEQDRMQQQAEYARQRDSEIDRLRQDRAEFDAQVRQTKAALVEARERHEQDLRLSSDIHAARLQTERAELEQQRDAWTEKFRREQLVLDNGLQFFEQYISRFSEEMKSAQHEIQVMPGSQSASTTTEQFAATIPFSQRSTPTKSIAMAVEETPTRASHHSEAEPVLLSLDEIRDRLNQIKNSQHQKAA